MEKKEVICEKCGVIGKPKEKFKHRFSIWFWLFVWAGIASLFVPMGGMTPLILGLVLGYKYFDTSKEVVCSSCGITSIIEVDTPRGQMLSKSIYENHTP